MIKLTTKDVLSEIITGVSNKLNKRALQRAIDLEYYDLNETLFAYYKDVNRLDHLELLGFHDVDTSDPEDIEFIKSMGGRIYKKPYNYKRGQLQPIRQKNTGFIAELKAFPGFRTWSSWLFDCYSYLSINDIELID